MSPKILNKCIIYLFIAPIAKNKCKKSAYFMVAKSTKSKIKLWRGKSAKRTVFIVFP